MATVVVSQTTGFDVNEFWVQNSASSTNENFESNTNTSLDLVARTRDESYSEFTFDAGGFKYNYVGAWNLHAENSLTEGATSSTGAYDSIVLEVAGVGAASVIGLASLDVDLGSDTGLPLINLNQSIVDP